MNDCDDASYDTFDDTSHDVPDDVPDQVADLYLSFHARGRLNQRGIGFDDLQIVLDCGARRRSHGDWILLLTDRALQNTPHEKQCDRLRGLCLVITAGHVVRTVKWDKKAARHPGILRRARRQKKQNTLSNRDLRAACRNLHNHANPTSYAAPQSMRHGIFSVNTLSECFLAA